MFGFCLLSCYAKVDRKKKIYTYISSDYTAGSVGVIGGAFVVGWVSEEKTKIAARTTRDRAISRASGRPGESGTGSPLPMGGTTGQRRARRPLEDKCGRSLGRPPPSINQRPGVVDSPLASGERRPTCFQSQRAQIAKAKRAGQLDACATTMGPENKNSVHVTKASLFALSKNPGR